MYLAKFNMLISIKTIFLVVVLLSTCHSSAAQSDPPPTSAEIGGSMAVSPSRFELEMKPGTEMTVVINLDYRSAADAPPARIMASLNDWSISKDGRVEYYSANSLRNSASSWMIYSPGEALVRPGTIHQIRVTISVPLHAAPGDHLAALVIEQRPDSIKYDQTGSRKMIVRYRMASVFYIKVSALTRKGSIEDLYAESGREGILITPTLKNEGNSMVRPLASIKILDPNGKIVADMPEIESFPVIAGGELKQPIRLAKLLAPGTYTVKYRVDFRDGERMSEGVTDLVVRAPDHVAALERPPTSP
jgi:hypothetical protein